MGPQGLLVVRLPALLVPHSASLGPAMATRVLSAPVPVSAPPTGLDECLFFYFLGVGLPCHSIFCQFWLCEEAQCVYLRRHLGSPINSLLTLYSFTILLKVYLYTFLLWYKKNFTRSLELKEIKVCRLDV